MHDTQTLKAYYEFKQSDVKTSALAEMLHDPIFKEAVSLLRERALPTGVYDQDNPDEALKRAGLRRVWEAGFHAAFRALTALSELEAEPESNLPPEWEYENTP